MKKTLVAVIILAMVAMMRLGLTGYTAKAHTANPTAVTMEMESMRKC